MVSGDDHNPLDLLQYQPRCQHETSVGQTSSIKQPEGIRVFTNHYGDGLVIDICTLTSMVLLTVRTYSLGNFFVVYDIKRQVYGTHCFSTKHERNGGEMRHT